MTRVNQNTAATDGKSFPETGKKLPDAPNGGGTALERVRHVKTGGEYEVLGEAETQISMGDGFTVNSRILREGNKLVVYRSTETGKLWVRFTDEFRDGRFETITPASQPDPAPIAAALEAAATNLPPSRASTYRRLAAVLREPGFGGVSHG